MIEQDTRYIINNNLLNKGWILDIKDKDKNVFFENPKTEEQRKKLKGKHPDYILYESKTNKPIAIIEAKKGGADLKQALQQGTEYAKALDAPLVFAMNGSYCETRYVPNQLDLFLNGNEVREVLREVEALKFLQHNTNEAYTLPKEFITSKQELITQFKKANGLLRNAGLMSGYERISEFANILFLKLISEQEGELDYWNEIKKQNNALLIDYLNNTIISGLEEKYGGNVFSSININADNFRNIVNMLDPLELSYIDTDIKGDAFEYFLKNMNQAENDLGQYFTPRHIVKTMVNLVDPKINEKIYDPFCGSGGFLTESFNYIKENSVLDQIAKNKLKTQTLYGSELTNVARIAKMNMILHGDGHNNILKQDSLANPVDSEYDVIITNMPFSLKSNNSSSLYYNNLGKGGIADATCVLHCLRALKKGGRMALVMPEGFLFKKNFANVREFLLSNAKLQSVISLPQGVFQPYTAVKTSILYFTKAHESNNQKQYWYFDVKNDGFEKGAKRKAIKGKNDIHKLNESDLKKADKDEQIKDNMLEIGFELVDLEEVKNNDYNLVGSFYKKTIQQGRYEMIKLGDVILDIKDGGTPPRKNSESEKYFNGNINWCVVKDIKNEIHDTAEKLTELGLQKCSAKLWPIDSVIISLGATIGEVGIAKKSMATKQGLSGIIVNQKKILPQYLCYILQSSKKEIQNMASGATIKEIRPSKLKEQFFLPLPPIEIQKQIVEQIEKERKIIDGARQIVDNWKPNFEIDESWDLISLEGIADNIKAGGDLPKDNYSKEKTNKYQIPIFANGKDKDGLYGYTNKSKFNGACVTVSARGTIGYAVERTEPFYPIVRLIVIEPNQSIIPKYLEYAINNIDFANEGTSIPQLTVPECSKYKIPLPPLEIQKKIVEKLENERKLIESNKELIKLQEEKIKNKLNSLWESKEQDKNEKLEADKSVFDSIVNKASKPLQ